MRPTRVAYLVNVFPKLSETFIAGEISELRRSGIEVRIYSLRNPTEELRHGTIDDLLPFTRYDPDNFLQDIQAFSPQLIHAHFATEPTDAARHLAAQLKIPFTFTAHGYDVFRKPPADFTQRAMAAAKVVTVSKANADYIAKTFSVPPKKIAVIGCGVDLERFCPSKVKHDNASPLIVCVARLVKVKNLGLLLNVCALLRDQNIPFRCVVIGDGPCRDDLAELQKKLDLETLIEFKGAATQSEVLRWWQLADIGVLSSQNEGMPVSLMEAAACGVATVAPNVGGISELIDHGKTGFLVAENNSQQFAAALEKLLRGESLRKSIGQAARARAEENFNRARQVEKLILLWSKILERKGRNAVSDPFNALGDPALPTLSQALDLRIARDELKHGLPRLSGENGSIHLKTLRVIRHKPGKRCVVEYDVRIQRHGAERVRAVLIGKLRARRFGNEGYRLLDAFWNAGFDDKSPDGISVPEPVGVLPSLQMWFQRKVRGKTATERFLKPGGEPLAKQIAEAIFKVHKANVPTEREHSVFDEVRILHECLGKVAVAEPPLKNRLTRILDACESSAAAHPDLPKCGSHRDFYPAQVIVQDERIYLLDFDLYCSGDVGLDAGNFLGHLVEQSLREFGVPDHFAEIQRALKNRFVELSGEASRASVEIYTKLTLVRHIFLSTKLVEQRPLTEALLNLCEEKLGIN